MSLKHQIFGRMYNAVRNKIRSAEEAGGRANENFRLLRRYAFYGASIYCTGQLFQIWYLEYGSAQGPSMYPTMPAKTPMTLTSKLHGHGKDMAVGDIVKFVSPIFRNQSLGKRVIGMPNDYVVLDPHQAASVGGAPVPGITDWRSQAEIDSGAELKEREEPMMIQIPEGHIYAVGDNMSWSRDSRFFGSVPMALVEGKQIAHASGATSLSGWQFTYGEQLRRIPKDEEEEYLKRWKQNQTEGQKPVAQPKTTATEAATTDVD